MIKKIIVKVPAQEAREFEKEILICDECKKVKRILLKCVLCGKQICNSCQKSDYSDASDHLDIHTYCPKCYQLRFEYYLEEIKKIEDDYERRMKDFLDKIRKESLKK
jgi:hypothetical protein